MDDVEVIRPAEGVAVVALHGEHDALTDEALGALLGSLVDESALVVVDVSDAEFVDSSFLRNLMRPIGAPVRGAHGSSCSWERRQSCAEHSSSAGSSSIWSGSAPERKP